MLEITFVILIKMNYMDKKLMDLAGKLKGAISATVLLVGDLNGDGKVDHEDAKIAADWA